MFVVKASVEIFQLRNFTCYENVTKLLSALFYWTYSFFWPPKSTYFSLRLCVSHWCYSPGVVRVLPSLTSIWQDPFSLFPLKLGGLCDLLWLGISGWEVMCHFPVDTLRASVWFPTLSSLLCWWWVKLKPLSARSLWVISMSNIFTLIINEKSKWSKEMFLWSASVQ